MGSMEADSSTHASIIMTTTIQYTKFPPLMMTNGDVEYRMASGAFLVSLRSSFWRVTGVMGGAKCRNVIGADDK